MYDLIDSSDKYSDTIMFRQFKRNKSPMNGNGIPDNISTDNWTSLK